MKHIYKNYSRHDPGDEPPVLPGFEHIKRYWDAKHDIFAAKIIPGEYYVSLHGELITTVLGSCVSACIRDPERGVGGMNHFMLPDSTNHKKSITWDNTPVSLETRYGNIAMERLINLILAGGGIRSNLEIKVFGGGKVLDISTNIGGTNVDFVKKYLATEGFEVVSEDVGGFCPRKIQYFPLTGRVRVKKLYSLHNDTLRKREQKYIESLSASNIEGKVDIFS